MHNDVSSREFYLKTAKFRVLGGFEFSTRPGRWARDFRGQKAAGHSVQEKRGHESGGRFVYEHRKAVEMSRSIPEKGKCKRLEKRR